MRNLGVLLLFLLFSMNLSAQEELGNQEERNPAFLILFKTGTSSPLGAYADEGYASPGASKAFEVAYFFKEIFGGGLRATYFANPFNEFTLANDAQSVIYVDRPYRNFFIGAGPIGSFIFLTDFTLTGRLDIGVLRSRFPAISLFASDPYYGSGFFVLPESNGTSFAFSPSLGIKARLGKYLTFSLDGELITGNPSFNLFLDSFEQRITVINVLAGIGVRF